MPSHLLTLAHAQKETYTPLCKVPLKGLTLDWKREFPMSWHNVTRWEQYAITIAVCIPSLEFIGMRMLADSWNTPCWSKSSYGRCDPKEYRWYRVVRRSADDSIHVKEVSSDDGKRVESMLFSLCRNE